MVVERESIPSSRHQQLHINHNINTVNDDKQCAEDLPTPHHVKRTRIIRYSHTYREDYDRGKYRGWET